MNSWKIHEPKFKFIISLFSDLVECKRYHFPEADNIIKSGKKQNNSPTKFPQSSQISPTNCVKLVRLVTKKSRPDCLYTSGDGRSVLTEDPYQKKKKHPSTIGNRYKWITNSSPSPSRPRLARLAYCHQIDSFCPTTLSGWHRLLAESIPGQLLLKMDDALFVCRRTAGNTADRLEGLLRTLLGAINFIYLAGLLFGPGGQSWANLHDKLLSFCGTLDGRAPGFTVCPVETNWK